MNNFAMDKDLDLVKFYRALRKAERKDPDTAVVMKAALTKWSKEFGTESS